MVFNPSEGADEALGPFPFFLQNNLYSVHLPFFPSNDILTVSPVVMDAIVASITTFPIQMHGQPMLTLS